MNLLSLLLLAAVSAKGDDVVARVDQVSITRSSFARRTELFATQRRSTAPDKVLDSLVVDALLAAEARRLGVDASPEAAAFVDRETRITAARALVDEFAAKAAPGDAVLREAFHQSSDFVRYTFLSYGSREEAQAALDRIRKGSALADEAKKAVESQLDPAKAPFQMRAQIGKELADALFAANPGDLVGPAELDPGFALAVLHEKQIGTDQLFAAKRESLLASARRQTAVVAREHLVEQLRAKAKIEVDEAFLAGLSGSSPSDAELKHVVAKLNGKPLVKYEAIWPQIRQLGGQSGHMANAKVKVRLANQAVDDRLVEDVAIERGFHRSAAVLSQRAELERSALAAACAERIQSAVPAPTDREVEDFHRRNAAYYGKPLELVRPQVAADAGAQKRADALSARVAELRKKAKVVVDEKALLAGGRG
ncbi:MAG TPA: peptidylprolyl isomerase [Anaeromyxobacter sp.]|nr:peptidylprolyl isomerase [Anaeromyxobacter sp.]